MVKAMQKKKNPDVYEVDEESLESFRTCGICGTVFDSEVSAECPQCHGNPSLTEEAEVSDEPEEVVCPQCGAKFDRSKMEVKDPFFGKKGRYCSACESLVEEVAPNPEEDSFFLDE